MNLWQLLVLSALLCLCLCRAEEDFGDAGEAVPAGGAGAGKPRKGGKRAGGKGKGKKNPQRAAMEAWAASLGPQDFNYTNWRVSFHSKSTVDFFNGYAKRLSAVFKEQGAKVNFAMVGACDGTGDITIKNLYLPNDHWRGVFVEPLAMNVKDLVKYMGPYSSRSLVIHAAATSQCVKPTLEMERPLYEEKMLEQNKTIPHWLRRQIGSLLPKTRDNPRQGWTKEEVRCVTASDILTDWANAKGGVGGGVEVVEMGAAGGMGMEEGGVGAEAARGRRKRRPHVLKIDVEGHDFDVLMGFMREDTPLGELPLLVDFEAKSIAAKFPAAKERMEAL
ncbi:hypothetical protein B484DRAFT_441692 [Ochromonadaceae sp. CCMP2298]|nr:hypothetical protein B484DRAFT_441692 [Ochromonadaceae sp. CCMP2298]